MSTYLCPKGHHSDEADYCSECGAKIQGAVPVETSAEAIEAIASLRNGMACPDCTTPHLPTDGNFCEICGYNFATGAQGQIPVKPTAAIEESVTAKQSPPDSIALPDAATGWVVVISVDPALRDPASPPAPEREAIALPLEKSISLIGRTSQMRAVYPDVPLDFDDAVSQRHALLTVQPDGSLILRDIGSSNGTKLNGVEVTVMADLPLQDGDELTLGHWTKVQILRDRSKSPKFV